jgi:hypothetical protein
MYFSIDQQRSRVVEMLGSDSLVLRVSRVALKRKGRANPYHVCFFFPNGVFDGVRWISEATRSMHDGHS